MDRSLSPQNEWNFLQKDDYLFISRLTVQAMSSFSIVGAQYFNI